MQTADTDGVYKNAEDLFSDSRLATEDAARALQSIAGPNLSLICNVKSAGNETYYRLDDAKVGFI